MSSVIVKCWGGHHHGLPADVRMTHDGRLVSVIDVIKIVWFSHDNGTLKPSAQKNASDYNKILLKDHDEVSTLQRDFKFPGQGQRMTPVTGRRGIIRIIQLLRGKRAAHFRNNIACLVEQYIDAKLGLADDITDRAWERAVNEASNATTQQKEETIEVTELHKRIRSRDSTKILGAALKQKGAKKATYGVMNGGVHQAVTGMHTKVYRNLQTNLKSKEAAREAFTECMLGMTSLVNMKVAGNLAAGKELHSQVTFIHEKCSQAAELLGLHEEARVVQERSHIDTNKHIMAAVLMADKRAQLQQAQSVHAIA